MSQTAPDPAFPRPGDTLVAVLNNVVHGKIVGSDRTACTIVDASANAQCTVTVGLSGSTLEGAFTQNVRSTKITGAVTGGTGRYVGGGGYFTLKRIGTTSNFNATVHLL